jgi:hypothetical protein
MNPTAIIIAAVLAAVVADITLIALWQRKSKKGEGSHRTGLFGTHSAMLA